ncbi:MAG: 50S ribosomal protein L18e [archaeon]
MNKKRNTIQNPRLKNLIKELEKKEGIWKDLGEELNKPNRKRAEVNLRKINRETENGEIALIPGKVLGYGEIDEDKKIEIASFTYSDKALRKIEKTKSKTYTIEEMKKKEPSKEKMKIIK